MISQLESDCTSGPHTVWGLEAHDLHDRYWAARGVQVVRSGDESALEQEAELFLLIDPGTLILFRMGPLADTLNWLQPRVLVLRVHDNREQGYKESVITDEDRFISFVRDYSASDTSVIRVAVTSDIEVARKWQQSPGARDGWRKLRSSIAQSDRATASIFGHAFASDCDHDLQKFVRELVQTWSRPDSTIDRATRLIDGAWADRGSPLVNGTRFIGPVWVGAGRELGHIDSVVGPAVLWDDPAARPAVDPVRWTLIELLDTNTPRPVRLRRRTSFQRGTKRAFDIVFSLLALCITLPFYPLIMFLIWIDDRAPFFFVHRRETLHGREFGCLKFRSMRNDAESIKADLANDNVADGPQFYIQNDPRLTRVGGILRMTNIDEWPQFFNVLLGDMSFVGPRPSPYSENQYCPAWREARLSVRPGITGMWQVRRSRKHGLDFQEWIRFDVYYVENMSWKLDLQLIWQTLLEVVKLRRTRSNRS